MTKTSCNETNCIVFRRLAEIHMSAFDLQGAAHAMRDAEAIADAVIWMKERFASLCALILKPGFKHPRARRLINQYASEQTPAIAGGIPVLALDIYEHAYH